MKRLLGLLLVMGVIGRGSAAAAPPSTPTAEQPTAAAESDRQQPRQQSVAITKAPVAPTTAETKRNAHGTAAVAGLSKAPAAESSIVLGIGKLDGSRYDAEFQRHDRRPPFFRKHGIQASLFDEMWLYGIPSSADQIYSKLKPYHVLHLQTTQEGLTSNLQDRRLYRKRATDAGQGLARFVKEGGGLFLRCSGVRYPGDSDIEYWNMLLEPLGITILHEAVFDKRDSFDFRTVDPNKIWHTDNIEKHAITKGVKDLYLPLYNNGPFPGLAAVRYSPEWQIVARGEQTAKSYKTDDSNAIDLNLPGTYTKSPPVVAVRTFGKGRVVSFPLGYIFLSGNHGNPIWPAVVETDGEKDKGRPSHTQQLMLNSIKWLSEPAQENPQLGTHSVEPYSEVDFPATYDWDLHGRFGKDEPGVRGIYGIHTTYTDGSGTVADYVQAAKQAGLSFIVFADPLEQLTSEELDQLKTDCEQVNSKEERFIAMPGIEFTDGVGLRWTFSGDTLIYPPASFKGATGFTYPQWDGKKVTHFGRYSQRSAIPGSGLLDYKQVYQAGTNPTTMWWYTNHILLSYERDKLIADNFGEYLTALRNCRWCSPASFTRIKDPADVALAAKTCFTGFGNLDQAHEALTWHAGRPSLNVDQYVSQGPIIAKWRTINSQMEQHVYKTRGAQRVRSMFEVRSENGICEVRVHDADRGLFRRYDASGAKKFQRVFEHVHDRQRYLVLEVIDTQGKRAMSNDHYIYSYKNGLFRCGDNLNFAGTANTAASGDRNEMIQVEPYFRNGFKFAVEGIDSISAICPQPRAYPVLRIGIKGQGWYPSMDTGYSKAQSHQLMKWLDVQFGSYNMNILNMKTTGKWSEHHSTDTRPEAPWCSLPRETRENEYFDIEQTLHVPMDRVDNYVALNHRRVWEGHKDYRGNIFWTEGTIRFKQDIVLEGKVPIPLVWMDCPTDAAGNWSTTLLVTDIAKTKIRRETLIDNTQPVGVQGRIRPGGFLSRLRMPVGYQALLVPKGMDFGYESRIPGDTFVGLGREGQEVKAGTVMKYRFGLVTVADERKHDEESFLEHTAATLNMDGGHTGYPVSMTSGTIENATYFLTLRAEKNEASFNIGPKPLMTDLNFRVRGIEDNGCVAVYSSNRPWFRFIAALDKTAYFQESIAQQADFWVGNVFVCDNAEVKIALVMDGQHQGSKPFIEVHNPTHRDMKTRVWSPVHTPIFGGISKQVEVPAGNSVRLKFAVSNPSRSQGK